MRVAFLGLGTMGAPMARNIARAGHELVVWNRTAASAEALAAELGVSRAASPADAARAAEVVITMVSDAAALTSVVDGPSGALAGMEAGTILINMCTVDPATIHSLAPGIAAARVTLIDAPVSGSRKPAVAGKLVILAAGEAPAIERARPVLEAMGSVRFVGPLGTGSALKLVVNSVGAHMISALSMALVLAAKLGLDPAMVIEVIQSGMFASPLYAAKTAKILAGDFSPDFSLALMLKDQEMVLETGRALGLTLPTVERIRDVLARAVEAGLGKLDPSALIQLYEVEAGIAVRNTITADRETL